MNILPCSNYDLHAGTGCSNLYNSKWNLSAVQNETYRLFVSKMLRSLVYYEILIKNEMDIGGSFTPFIKGLYENILYYFVLFGDSYSLYFDHNRLHRSKRWMEFLKVSFLDFFSSSVLSPLIIVLIKCIFSIKRSWFPPKFFFITSTFIIPYFHRRTTNPHLDMQLFMLNFVFL